jgi:predicted GNAT family N-acyltransferase
MKKNKPEVKSFERRRSRIPAKKFTSSLPFEIRLMRTADKLKAIVESRVLAYESHHLANLNEILGEKKYDGKDTQRNTVLLYAIKKETNEILGSLRIYTNTNRPLQVELEYELPEPYRDKHLASLGRLAITRGSNAKQVKYALLKSAYLYSVAFQIHHWLLATIKPMDRIYRRFGFSSVFTDSTKIQLHEASLKLELLGTTHDQFVDFIKSKLPDFHEFVFERHHTDIKLFQSVANCWDSPRSNETISNLPPER